MGKGFPVDTLADDVNTVLLFAAGTGISPIKAVIESGKLDGKKVSKQRKKLNGLMEVSNKEVESWYNSLEFREV